MASLYELSLAVVLPVLHVLTWHHGSAHPWNALQSTFGRNLSDPKHFIALPRTAEAARQAGFSETFNCSSELSRTFRGTRYVKESDPTVALLYDINGYIAGIQSIVPDDVDIHTSINRAPFVSYLEGHALTVYFVDPAIICTTGRTAAQFNEQGTGTRLYLQTDPFANESVILPLFENETTNTLWSNGGCLNEMGTYYWYNVENSKLCKFYPIYLMFTNQRLSAFGFLYKGNIPSLRYEHPQPAHLMEIERRSPHCLQNVHDLSDLPVILVDDVTLLRCQPR